MFEFFFKDGVRAPSSVVVIFSGLDWILVFTFKDPILYNERSERFLPLLTIRQPKSRKDVPKTKRRT